MFTLAEVVPWGRSLAEYRRMFALSDADLASPIFGCADGPASFNAELTTGGGAVISGDPLYRFAHDEIARRIDETFDVIMTQTRRNEHEFVWGGVIPDIEALGRMRRAAMSAFLADFEQGKATGRYVDCELPSLPFADDQFALALCSHFLFLYSEQCSADFHAASLRELCRIASEVRIFPLLELGSRPSRHRPAVIDAMRADGYLVDVVPVDYEFQRGGSEMLRLRRPG